MRNLLLATIAILGACGDDGGTALDSGGSGSACTNALYDPCTDPAQCNTENCRAFNMPSPGIQICTQACGPDSPCPTPVGGATVQCTNAGVCRPSAANNCTR